LDYGEQFKAHTELIEYHPKDLNIFLGEHQFFGIKNLKSIFSIDKANIFQLFLLNKLVSEQGL
jgi:hypothetical protein